MGDESSAASIRTVRALQGQLPLMTLEEQCSAGQHIHREFDEVERLRRDLLTSRADPRQFPPDVAGRLLSVWNAYVLQTIGEHLLEAVRYRTFGTVRAEVVSRILDFVGPADRWMYQARLAEADPSYRVEDHIDLPAEPPAWPDQRYRSYPLSAAMAAAVQQIHATGETILTEASRTLVPSGEDLYQLQEILDNAAGAVEYAVGPHDALGVPVSPAVHLRHALRMLFLFGQATAMPALLETQNSLRVVSLISGVPSNNDPWCLTDPQERNAWRSLPAARTGVERLWAEDTFPTVTMSVQEQIDAAFRSDTIVLATDQAGEHLGSFHRCPWPAIYEVRRPVTIGGTRLYPMQQFTFDVLGEAYAPGRPYAREIVASVFVPADPVAPSRDDDRAGRSENGRRGGRARRSGDGTPASTDQSGRAGRRGRRRQG